MIKHYNDKTNQKKLPVILKTTDGL